MLCCHRESRVETSRIKLTNARQRLFGLNDNSRAQEGGHASRVMSRPVRLAKSRVLMPHALVQAVGFPPVTGRDSCYCVLRN